MTPEVSRQFRTASLGKVALRQSQQKAAACRLPHGAIRFSHYEKQHAAVQQNSVIWKKVISQC
jgi:hypothetical protein